MSYVRFLLWLCGEVLWSVVARCYGKRKREKRDDNPRDNDRGAR